MEWEVDYDDGESEATLCRECIRPYVPYAMDEAADWRSDEDIFYNARVVGIGVDEDGEETYDVLLLDSDEVLEGILPVHMRRVDLRRNPSRVDSGFAPGTRVVAMFNGLEDEWYAGFVTSRNRDGTYRIQYDDGDAEEAVIAEYIVLEE